LLTGGWRNLLCLLKATHFGEQHADVVVADCVVRHLDAIEGTPRQRILGLDAQKESDTTGSKPHTLLRFADSKPASEKYFFVIFYWVLIRYQLQSNQVFLRK
jgi:hypothetical protein